MTNRYSGRHVEVWDREEPNRGWVAGCILLAAVAFVAFMIGYLWGSAVRPVPTTTTRPDASGAAGSVRVSAQAQRGTSSAPTPPPNDSHLPGGIVAYADPTYGTRYLAIPEGPGVTVRICTDHCIVRISTDAGPALSMQRLGRVADLSYVDFADLCRCDPRLVGTMRVSMAGAGPHLTPPPTDTE